MAPDPDKTFRKAAQEIIVRVGAAAPYASPKRSVMIIPGKSMIVKAIAPEAREESAAVRYSSDCSSLFEPLAYIRATTGMMALFAIKSGMDVSMATRKAVLNRATSLSGLLVARIHVGAWDMRMEISWLPKRGSEAIR